MLSEEALPKEEKNFEIEETEDAYRAYFFSDARDGRLYKFQKYQVMYGWQGDLPVPKWLDYYKKYYTREEAEGYASKIEDGDGIWLKDFERDMSELIGKPVIAIFEMGEV